VPEEMKCTAFLLCVAKKKMSSALPVKCYVLFSSKFANLCHAKRLTRAQKSMCHFKFLASCNYPFFFPRGNSPQPCPNVGAQEIGA
jgi:hypothetical protein